MSLTLSNPIIHPFEDTESGEMEEERINERWYLPPILEDAFAIGLFGKRGSGKTAVMTKMLKDEVKENGKKVWYWPKEYEFKYGQYISATELFSLPSYLQDGAIGIDEIQVLANSTQAISTRNQMLSVFLQQVRKRGINVYFTSNEPERLDKSIARHTNIHFRCKLMVDPRCKVRGYHMRSCDDHVILRSVDTNREFGVDPRYKDGKRRGIHVVWKIRDVYGAYNTRGIADYAEVLSIDKRSIMDQKENKDAGIGFSELCATLRDLWVPWAVGEGHTKIVPAMFCAAVNEKFGFKVTPTQMGRALNELGLNTKRSNGKRSVELPPQKHLEAWQAGFWSPD